MNNTEKEKVRFDEGNILKLQSGKFTRYYGVQLQIKQEQKEEQNLSFEFKIISEVVDDGLIVIIERNNLKINNQIPNLAFDELAYRCGNVIYPLKVKVNYDLIPIKLLNHQAIIKRWVQTKKEIENDHNNLNNEVEKYLAEMQKSLVKKESILQTVKTDLFLSALFVPLHTDYSPLYSTSEVKCKIPMVPFSESIIFKTKQKVDKYYTTYNTITIRQSGTIADDRSAYDIVIKCSLPFNKGTKAEGKLSSTYQIEKETKIVYSILADYSINLPYGESREIALKAFQINKKEHL